MLDWPERKKIGLGEEGNPWRARRARSEIAGVGSCVCRIGGGR